MRSPDNTETQFITIEKSTLLLLAVALNTLELFIPRIPLLPWLKPGLANCITLLWIIRFGTADALMYSLLRIWIGSFYFGFSLITFCISCSGSMLATLGMGITWTSIGKKGYIGTIGCAIIGATLHNTGQLVAVFLLLTRNAVVFYQIPFMGAASLLFGSLIGAITPVLWNVFTREPPVPAVKTPVTVTSSMERAGSYRWIVILLLIAGSFSLLLLENIPFLLIVTIAVSMIVFFISSRNWKTIFHPLRFWFLFLFIGAVYLFFSYGTSLPYIPVITYEALSFTAAQFLRLWTWLQISVILHRLGCNQLLFSRLQRLFPHHADTLLAGLVALEHFGDVLDFVRSGKAHNGLDWKKPVKAVHMFALRVESFFLANLDL